MGTALEIKQIVRLSIPRKKKYKALVIRACRTEPSKASCPLRPGSRWEASGRDGRARPQLSAHSKLSLPRCYKYHPRHPRGLRAAGAPVTATPGTRGIPERPPLLPRSRTPQHAAPLPSAQSCCSHTPQHPLSKSLPCLKPNSLDFMHLFLSSGNPLPYYSVILLLPFSFFSLHCGFP